MDDLSRFVSNFSVNLGTTEGAPVSNVNTTTFTPSTTGHAYLVTGSEWTVEKALRFSPATLRMKGAELDTDDKALIDFIITHYRSTDSVRRNLSAVLSRIGTTGDIMVSRDDLSALSGIPPSILDAAIATSSTNEEYVDNIQTFSLFRAGTIITVGREREMYRFSHGDVAVLCDPLTIQFSDQLKTQHLLDQIGIDMNKKLRFYSVPDVIRVAMNALAVFYRPELVAGKVLFTNKSDPSIRAHAPIEYGTRGGFIDDYCFMVRNVFEPIQVVGALANFNQDPVGAMLNLFYKKFKSFERFPTLEKWVPDPAMIRDRLYNEMQKEIGAINNVNKDNIAAFRQAYIADIQDANALTKRARAFRAQTSFMDALTHNSMAAVQGVAMMPDSFNNFARCVKELAAIRKSEDFTHIVIIGGKETQYPQACTHLNMAFLQLDNVPDEGGVGERYILVPNLYSRPWPEVYAMIQERKVVKPYYIYTHHISPVGNTSPYTQNREAYVRFAELGLPQGIMRFEFPDNLNVVPDFSVRFCQRYDLVMPIGGIRSHDTECWLRFGKLRVAPHTFDNATLIAGGIVRVLLEIKAVMMGISNRWRNKFIAAGFFTWRQDISEADWSAILTTMTYWNGYYKRNVKVVGTTYAPLAEITSLPDFKSLSLVGLGVPTAERLERLQAAEDELMAVVAKRSLEEATMTDSNSPVDIGEDTEVPLNQYVASTAPARGGRAIKRGSTKRTKP